MPEDPLNKRPGFSDSAREHVQREVSAYQKCAKHPDHPDKKKLQEKFKKKYSEFKQKHQERHGG